jgi:hypothetical protein
MRKMGRSLGAAREPEQAEDEVQLRRRVVLDRVAEEHAAAIAALHNDHRLAQLAAGERFDRDIGVGGQILQSAGEIAALAQSGLGSFRPEDLEPQPLGKGVRVDRVLVMPDHQVGGPAQGLDLREDLVLEGDGVEEDQRAVAPPRDAHPPGEGRIRHHAFDGPEVLLVPTCARFYNELT